MPNIFFGVVESKLSYHEARRDIRDDYLGVMIDDERLVGLKVRCCRDRVSFLRTCDVGADVCFGGSIRRF